jgi:hypothetical protein
MTRSARQSITSRCSPALATLRLIVELEQMIPSDLPPVRRLAPMTERLPVRRAGNAAEIAEAALYLVRGT